MSVVGIVAGFGVSLKTWCYDKKIFDLVLSTKLAMYVYPCRTIYDILNYKLKLSYHKLMIISYV